MNSFQTPTVAASASPMMPLPPMRIRKMSQVTQKDLQTLTLPALGEPSSFVLKPRTKRRKLFASGLSRLAKLDFKEVSLAKEDTSSGAPEKKEECQATGSEQPGISSLLLRFNKLAIHSEAPLSKPPLLKLKGLSFPGGKHSAFPTVKKGLRQPMRRQVSADCA